MRELIAVPNVSEGRDLAALRAIGEAFEQGGARLLDRHEDPDHHRAVFTLAGEPGSLAQAVLAGAREAIARIDLTAHEGQHPRVGAVDVAPIVYLDPADRGAAIAEALPEPNEVLHLGGGGFTFPRYLRATDPASSHLVLEIDDELPRIARRHLGLQDDDRLDIRIGDARLAFDDLADDSFDLVVGDAFASTSVPWHLSSSREVVDAETEARVRPRLPVADLWGVGPATSGKLHDAGIVLVADLAGWSVDALVERRVARAMARTLVAIRDGEDDATIRRPTARRSVRWAVW